MLLLMNLQPNFPDGLFEKVQIAVENRTKLRHL